MRLAHVLCLAAVSVFIEQAAGQSTNTLGLTQAVEAALENNALVRSARLRVDQADNRVAEARAERVPKLRMSETFTRGNNPVFVFGSLLEQGGFAAHNFSLSALNNPESTTNLRTVVSASFPLFDGMRTSARIAQSNIGNDQALHQKQLAEQRVRFDVVENYFGLRGEQFHRVRERNQKLLKEAETRGTVKVFLNSKVKEISADRVCLESGGGTVTVENDFVLALIGGESPEDFLRRVGVEIVEKTI
jgi:hypothetical protein